MAFDHHPEPEDAWNGGQGSAKPSFEPTRLRALEVCRAIVAAHLEVPIEDVSPSAHLEKDLGISRLGLVLIGLDLEDLEHVTLPFELLEEIDTVEQLGRFLQEARRSSRRLPVDAAHHPIAR